MASQHVVPLLAAWLQVALGHFLQSEGAETLSALRDPVIKVLACQCSALLGHEDLRIAEDLQVHKHTRMGIMLR